ncbi:hypothetical protein KIL84_007259 [Mauremys mutica]|uniref:Uncharacterized protein n=1 Tax=Mauremys mutica TaxID=74926 RepID=A0A9D3X2G8_9SAUR|nr:hypothetical protein KIL84_007259 [Mauremys mutica]
MKTTLSQVSSSGEWLIYTVLIFPKSSRARGYFHIPYIHVQLQAYCTKLPDDVRERWETFCTNSLGETNKRNTMALVTTCHIHSSSDDEIDFKETGFSQDSSLQQYINLYFFCSVSFDRVSDINFTLNTNESIGVPGICVQQVLIIVDILPYLSRLGFPINILVSHRASFSACFMNVNDNENKYLLLGR